MRGMESLAETGVVYMAKDIITYSTAIRMGDGRVERSTILSNATKGACKKEGERLWAVHLLGETAAADTAAAAADALTDATTT